VSENTEEQETAAAAEEAAESTTHEEGGETADTTGKGWNSATKARFDEINTRMKQAEERANKYEARAEKLEGQLEAALETKATESAEPLKPPPGMSQDQQVEWLIENTTAKWFKREFGMSPADAREALKSLPAASENAQRARWESMCEKAGIDPNDRKVMRYARGIGAEDGATLESIVKECAVVFGKQPEKKRKTLNQMEVGSETAEMIAEDELPFTKREATKAAREGRKAPHLDAAEILDRASRAKRARA